MKFLIETPRSRFIKVECKKCKNEQIIFDKASTIVKCTKCGEILARPTGSKIELLTAKLLRRLT
jgi:small subunit ribosomal protein S27e